LWDALNAFIDTTQKRVNGTVDLRLYKGSVTVLGRFSPDSFYSIDAASFDSTAIDQTDAIGFSMYYGLQARMVRKKLNK